MKKTNENFLINSEEAPSGSRIVNKNIPNPSKPNTYVAFQINGDENLIDEVLDKFGNNFEWSGDYMVSDQKIAKTIKYFVEKNGGSFDIVPPELKEYILKEIMIKENDIRFEIVGKDAIEAIEEEFLGREINKNYNSIYTCNDPGIFNWIVKLAEANHGKIITDIKEGFMGGNVDPTNSSVMGTSHSAPALPLNSDNPSNNVDSTDDEEIDIDLEDEESTDLISNIFKKMVAKENTMKIQQIKKIIKEEISKLKENDGYPNDGYEKINNDDYKWYVITIDDDNTKKILSGWEYKEDAEDFKDEHINYFENMKIFPKSFIKSRGFDPDNDQNWQKG